jgi:hypothetical protein
MRFLSFFSLMLRRITLVWLLLAALIPAVQATTVVINSDDWIDVYSGLQYAYLHNYYAKFMTSKRYAVVLPLILPKGEKVLVIESQRVPFSINLAGNLNHNGYTAETVYSSGGRATNIELAKLTDTRRFIVIDPAYGYNAIAVIPYAQLTDAYVLFADQKNIDQVLAFLNNRPVDYLMLYGQLDPGLVEKLAIFNPEVINKGNRYKNNLEILRKYLAIQPSPQLILTDGSFIEEELMKAGKNREVTLLIGKGTPPEDVVKFVRESRFPAGVLIGNHLTSSGKRLKELTGVPVFMKFGIGIGTGTQSEPVKALDMFPLPVVNLELALKKAQYNTVTKSVEITYENKGIRAFSRGSAGILAEGQRVLTVGDTDVQRMEANETRGFQYAADLTRYIAERKNLSIDLFTLYGESADTFDQAIAFTGALPVVTLQDKCELSVKSLEYNTRTQRFLVSIENDGAVDCFADAELRAVIIDDKPATVEYPGTLTVAEDDSLVMEIKQRMTDVDLADNPEVLVHLRYGEREDLMLNVLDVRLPLREFTGSRITPTMILSGVVVLLLLIIIVMFFVMRRRKK